MFAAMLFFLDDWYGSRQTIARLRDALLEPRWAFARFGFDVLIAIVAFPTLMAAAYGSRAVGLGIAFALILGACWFLFCLLGIPSSEIRARLYVNLIIHLCLAGIVFLWYNWKYVSIEQWLDPNNENFTGASLIVALVVANRVFLPLMWNLGKRLVEKKTEPQGSEQRRRPRSASGR
jgi:hypothetical protein